jgi:hypothetical protein
MKEMRHCSTSLATRGAAAGALCFLVAIILVLSARSATAADAVQSPLELISIIWPKDNPYSPEKTDLVAFLHALSGEGWQHIHAPEILPQ